MVLEGYRGWAAPRLDRLVRPFLGVRASSLSWTSLALSASAGALAALARFTTPIVFLGVGLLVFLGGLFDVLDGEVARRTGQAGPRGDLLDHVLDRYADLVILLGIAISGYANAPLTLLALVSLLMTSYMGTQSQAVGVGRIYRGLLARADRLVLLTLASLVLGDLALPWPWAPTAPWVHLELAGLRFTVLDLVMAWFVIAGQWTAIGRAVRSYRALSAPPR